MAWGKEGSSSLGQTRRQIMICLSQEDVCEDASDILDV
jgi:hypothetical protein